MNEIKPVAAKFFSVLSDDLKLKSFHDAGHDPMYMVFADTSRSLESRDPVEINLGQKHGYSLRYGKPSDYIPRLREQAHFSLVLPNLNLKNGSDFDGFFKRLKRSCLANKYCPKDFFRRNKTINIKRLITRNLTTDGICEWSLTEVLIDDKADKRLEMVKVNGRPAENYDSAHLVGLAGGMMELTCASVPKQGLSTVCTLVARKRGYK